MVFWQKGCFCCCVLVLPGAHLGEVSRIGFFVLDGVFFVQSAAFFCMHHIALSVPLSF